MRVKISHGMVPAALRVIEGGDGLVALTAEEDDFVAGGYVGNVGDVDDGLIHADASDERAHAGRGQAG